MGEREPILAEVKRAPLNGTQKGCFIGCLTVWALIALFVVYVIASTP